MKQHLEILGHEATDVVTGFTGVISSISFDLYGCVQAVVVPKMTAKGELGDGRWFDTSRLKITSKKPVMGVPNFSKFEPQKIPGGQKLPVK